MISSERQGTGRPQSTTHGFQARGYRVLDAGTFRDPLEEQARECGWLLQRQGEICGVLGLRWILVVTSDVIGRFTRALSAGQVDRAMIMTTSFYTDAAVEYARGRPMSPSR